jgi:alkyl sulfatase BDS1-like metallo-beta-lactamase superfamily hydrolase
MGGHTLALTDRLLRGDASVEEVNPVVMDGELDEVAPGVAFVPSFGNIAAFTAGGELLLVDTGNNHVARHNHAKVRGWTDLPLTTAVFTHGHIDHVLGLGPYEAEAEDAGRDPAAIHVVAHEKVPARFDRYKATAGYNGVINARQFKLPSFRWPTDYRYPDETYADRHTLTVGGETFELRHAEGETDDHTWVWVPGRKVLCTGDMFIWASPNCGNPQKVQRYPRQWAVALREMAGLGAELMLPGHGWPIAGAGMITTVLTDAADLLDSLVDQTLALMNEGARLDEVVHAVVAPAHLVDKPYLRPVYDEPEFVVRNVWRLYGGWYDGNPAGLKPAPEADLARELAELAGGPSVLAARAEALAEAGDLRLAGHLAELAAQAAPDDAGVHRVRAAVFGRRASEELSTMSKGVFSWAAAESEAAAAVEG